MPQTGVGRLRAELWENTYEGNGGPASVGYAHEIPRSLRTSGDSTLCVLTSIALGGPPAHACAFNASSGTFGGLLPQQLLHPVEQLIRPTVQDARHVQHDQQQRQMLPPLDLANVGPLHLIPSMPYRPALRAHPIPTEANVPRALDLGSDAESRKCSNE